jgi:phosphoglycerate dehydrogenase-like enzyme
VIRRLKPGCVLVNTARGTLIDQRALARGLAANRPGYAALDVFAAEPPDLTEFAGVEDRLLLSPHMAWYTEESEHDLRSKAAHEVRRLLLGERPRDVVTAPSEETR